MSEQDAEERAYFGLACFWGAEGIFGTLEGVKRTRVGYCGGHGPPPIYPSVGDHTEAVEVTYSPSALSYDQLLQLFWKSHDPCTCKCTKPQYMAAVFYTDDKQRHAAEKSREAVVGKAATTQILPLNTFHEAENYHQKYFLRTYHRAFYEGLPKEDPVTSTRDARLNGFLSDHGTLEDLKSSEPLLNLTEEQVSYVKKHMTGEQKPPVVEPFVRTVLQVAWNYAKMKTVG